MGLCGQLSWSPLWCFITTCHGSPAAGGIHSSPPPVLQSWPPLSKVLSGLSWLSRVRLPRLRVLPPYRRGPCEDGVPLQEDGMQVSAASAVRPKGSWPRRPPRTPGKPLPRTPALSPLSEFHNPAGLAGKGGSGSCRFICTWIIGHWDFVRAVRHPNCPGASGFGAGETRGGGWGGGGAKATCGASHADGAINLGHFLHLLLLRQCFPEGSALPLSRGVLFWSPRWTSVAAPGPMGRSLNRSSQIFLLETSKA